MIVADKPLESEIENSPAIPAEVLDRLRLRANNLRMLPAIATEALEIAKDPDCAINEFAAVVERDASLASDILRLANSVLFGASRATLNLHHAVVRLGFRQCKNLIMASSFSSMMKRMSLEEEWAREVLCRHSYMTALVALNLNRTLKAGFHGEEFAAGLIHDIGRMLMAVCFPQEISQIDPMDFEEGQDILSAEFAAIQTNHCEIGAWFTLKNALPEALTDIVRYHHTPRESRQNKKFVALIAASDHIANHLQRTDEIKTYDPTQNWAIPLLEEFGVPGGTARFESLAHDIMAASVRDSAEMMKF